jgi:hypothetical protein
MPDTQNEAATNGEAAASTSTNRDPSPPNPDQNKQHSLNVLEGGKSDAIQDLRDIPVLKKFADDHDLPLADLNKMWREEIGSDGYPKVVAHLTFSGDGFKCKNITAPSSELQDELKAAIAAAKLPTIQRIVYLADGPPGVDLNSPDVFICHDFDGSVLMIEQRYKTADGGKGFIPWTKWSDGIWRKTAPAINPFYGLPGGENKPTLFIHEGAKAAARVKRIIAGDEDASRFPWKEEVMHGHHIGWTGGINAVEQSNWAKLSMQGFKRVIIVADNDGGGVDVSAEITRHFRCPAYIIRFGSSFPDHFDMGDKFPDTVYDEKGAYIGPSFNECLQPFDRATDLVTVTGPNGRPKLVPVLRETFFQRHRAVAETQQVFCIDRPSLAKDKKHFNDEMRARSDAADTYGLLIQHPQAVCARRVYRPDTPPGPVIDNGEVSWNGFEPPTVRPSTGSVLPWLEYLEHLFPIESDRHEVMRWLATLIVCRRRKMHYSLLLVSKTQGVGKSTLGLILKQLLGASNVSFPGESAFDNPFNSWALGKLLIFVNEIYTNGNAKSYDKVKTYVTDEVISINEKNVKQFYIENWAVFIACSNSEKALFLPDEDRRWLVPTVTNELQDQAWWEAFHAWLNTGGFGCILTWAKEFARLHSVKQGDRPPSTTAKQAIIAENKSEGRLLARDFAEEFADMEPAVVRVSDIRAWIAAKRGIEISHQFLEKEKIIISELECCERLHVWKGDARPKIGGRRGEKTSVVFNFPTEPGATWGQVEDRLKTLEELGFSPPM